MYECIVVNTQREQKRKNKLVNSDSDARSRTPNSLVDFHVTTVSEGVPYTTSKLLSYRCPALAMKFNSRCRRMVVRNAGSRNSSLDSAGLTNKLRLHHWHTAVFKINPPLIMYHPHLGRAVGTKRCSRLEYLERGESNPECWLHLSDN
jgi:hypothetical protein